MAHPFLASGPVAIAHRGGAHLAPENTMAAFTSAVEMGFRYLETDVHLSRDGVVVAFHDDRLDRVTDRSGLISQLTVDQIEQADAGYHFSSDGTSYPWRGKGERVPRLEDLLTSFDDARVNIDPKHDAVVEPLCALLDRLNSWHRVCIGSFSDRRLRQIRRLARGKACTSMGPKASAAVWLGSFLRRATSTFDADCLQVPIKFKGVRVVTRRFIETCHRRGLPVHIWTVNQPDQMDALLDLGVDGLMTDDPAALAEVFSRRELPLDGAV